MGPNTTLTIEEEKKLVEYKEKIVRMAHPLSPSDLKLKIAEMCQQRESPFKDGIPGRSWLKLFKKRHLHLVMRILQGFDINRERNLYPSLVQIFYKNLQSIYNQREYHPSHIWNVNESGANTSRNQVGKVFAPRGLRNVHILIPNERE